MKKQIKPIAMRCTQEQFDAIKPKLVKGGMNVKSIYRMIECPYLTNNFCGVSGDVSNLHIDCISDHNRTVFEQWNEKTFLEYCGIETETIESIQAEIERLQAKLEELKKDEPMKVDESWLNGNNGIKVRANGEYKDKGFYLSSGYNWELVVDSEGLNVLVPTRKD